MYYQLMAGAFRSRVDVERIEATVSVGVCFVRRKLAKIFCCDFPSVAILRAR